MGVIKKVPVITEEYDRLTEETKNDPHELFKAINDPKNAKGSYFFKMRAFFDNEKKQNELLKQKQIEVGFQSKQINDISTPFALYPMPNLKTIKVNKIEAQKYVSLPPMNANYRPQRKQYSPKEVKQYMTSTIDLSQPDFTHCPIKDIRKHSEYVRMEQAYASDKKFSEKYSKTMHKNMINRSQSQKVINGHNPIKNNLLIRNSMYILPHLKDQTVSFT